MHTEYAQYAGSPRRNPKIQRIIKTQFKKKKHLKQKWDS